MISKFGIDIETSIFGLALKVAAPFMRSRYIYVTVAFESIYGLIEKNERIGNAMVTRMQPHKRSHITASVLI